MSDSPLSPSPINVTVRSVDALLDVDGSALAGPRLHPEVADNVWFEALQRDAKGAFAVDIAVPPDDLGRTAEVQEAVTAHFARRQMVFREELRSLFREGWRSLFIGLLVVALLLTLAEAIPYLWERRLAYAVSESLIIVAWVVLWHPAELLLYAHFPVRRHLRLAGALAAASVRLRGA